MKQIELIQQEIRASEEDLFKVHLYLEGDWWRAYEWSSYLCEHFPNNLEPSQRLKAIHRPLKDTSNGIISVGLKLSSFDKYLPNVSQTNDIIQIDDKHMVLDVTNFYESNISLDNYKEIFSEWKNSISYKEDTVSKSLSVKTVKIQNNASLTAIVQQILGYPLEKKTMIENTLFISELKEQIIRFI